ncbi:MAG: RimK family alpha-L-glutamate ligase [Candidatus Bathyarchaeia archaeon]
MRIGLLTRNENAWCSSNLRKSFNRLGVEAFCFNFRDLLITLQDKERFLVKGCDLKEYVSSILVRPIGRGSLEEVIFELDALHRLKANGVVVVNDPETIEVAADKYHTISKLKEKGIPVPETYVTMNHREALKASIRMGGRVVLKPLFGSRGIGLTLISNKDVLERSARTLTFLRHVLYLQKFIPHGRSDIRAFVIGGRLVSAMRRVSKRWKTNISQGAKPIPLKLSGELESLTIKAAEAIGCEIAGIDIVEGPEGPLVIEVNSQPGWRGIQQVTSTNISDEIAKYMVRRSKC